MVSGEGYLLLFGCNFLMYLMEKLEYSLKEKKVTSTYVDCSRLILLASSSGIFSAVSHSNGQLLRALHLSIKITGIRCLEASLSSR